jgi:hypothetical protein|nr:MAG TPA: Helix-turn-helix XRE-family like protein [Caudoviricetes sp.]
MPENCKALIDDLIKLRKYKGLTQKELAKSVNLTQSAIARLESKKTTPQLDTLLKVTSALGCVLKIEPII